MSPMTKQYNAQVQDILSYFLSKRHTALSTEPIYPSACGSLLSRQHLSPGFLTIHGVVAWVIPTSSGPTSNRTSLMTHSEIYGVLLVAAMVVEQCDGPCWLRDSDDDVK